MPKIEKIPLFQAKGCKMDTTYILLVVKDNRDIIIVTKETCLECLETQQNTKVLKWYGGITEEQRREMKQNDVQMVQCLCKRSHAPSPWR